MSRKTLEALSEALGVEVRAHQAAVDALDEAVAAHLGLNRTDLRCLDVLLQMGSASPGQLGTRLGLTTGSVTAMLDRLAKAEYLTRSPDPTDRRKVVVQPTPVVIEKAGELYGPLAEEGASDVARYTQAELELLIDFLRRGREQQEKHLTLIRAMGTTATRR
jgi:DNA-binding MarR family transcriptional regulator